MRNSLIHPKGMFLLVLGFGSLAFISLYAILAHSYPGSPLTLATFLFCGVFLLGSAIYQPSSVYVIVTACFLFAGFVAKSLFHFAFSVHLIEPIGSFSDQWDTALSFASAGLAGAAAAAMVSKAVPSFRAVNRARVDPEHSNVVALSLVVVLCVAFAIYWTNHQLTILKIGYPQSDAVPAQIYAGLSFLITWGALLGALSLAAWLTEMRRWSYCRLIYVASIIGLLASLTMGSRIQLLLYVLCAVLAFVLRKPGRDMGQWWKFSLAMMFAGAVFALSFFVVSVDRTYEWVISPGAPAAVEQGAPADEPSFADRVIAVADPERAEGLLAEIRSLAVMRWVGLEGAMTMAGVQDRLGLPLLEQGFREDPSAGAGALYQRFAGDFYAGVDYFTFMSFPGPIGFASYSGSLPTIFAFMFVLVLSGHFVEWIASRVTQNMATICVVGVSLAYLTVQMAFPWTIVAYTIQLLAAVLALGLWRKLAVKEKSWLTVWGRSASMRRNRRQAPRMVSAGFKRDGGKEDA